RCACNRAVESVKDAICDEKKQPDTKMAERDGNATGKSDGAPANGDDIGADAQVSNRLAGARENRIDELSYLIVDHRSHPWSIPTRSLLPRRALLPPGESADNVVSQLPGRTTRNGVGSLTASRTCRAYHRSTSPIGCAWKGTGPRGHGQEFTR